MKNLLHGFEKRVYGFRKPWSGILKHHLKGLKSSFWGFETLFPRFWKPWSGILKHHFWGFENLYMEFWNTISGVSKTLIWNIHFMGLKTLFQGFKTPFWGFWNTILQLCKPCFVALKNWSLGVSKPQKLVQTSLHPKVGFEKKNNYSVGLETSPHVASWSLSGPQACCSWGLAWQQIQTP